MDTDNAITYRLATKRDLLGAAQVYLRAFPESLEELHTPNLTPLAIADVLLPAIVAEPDCLIVAEDADRIVGYCLSPAYVGRIARAAVLHGILFTWAWHFLTGRYGMGFRSLWAVLGDKLSFRGADRAPDADCPSRILSIAVDPAYQGRGLGKMLLRIALNRFRGLGLTCARLEVRPANVGAKGLYLRHGFRDVGQFQDTRGAWDIMMADLAPPEGEAPAA
jgi:ribosomal protein S18 acetylase RimI-like enzyme